MTTISYLSTELQQHVLRYLDQKCLLECTLVCKKWKYTAQSIVYSQLHIFTPHQFRMIENAWKMSGDSPGKFVKQFKCLHFDFRRTLEDLTAVSNLFPYLEYIFLLDPDDNLYDNLVTLHKESMFLWLENFSYWHIDYLENIYSYTQCALEFRNTLADLRIVGEYILTDDKDSCYYSFRKYLKEFTRLQVLRIYNMNTITLHNMQTISLYDSIIDDCKSVKHLSFRTTYARNHAAVGSTKDYLLETITPQTNVSSLELATNMFTRDNFSAYYIKKKFPNLTSFKLEDNVRSFAIDEERSSLTRIITSLEHITSYVSNYDIQYPKLKQGYQLASEFWSLPLNKERNKKLEITFCNHFTTTDKTMDYMSIKTLDSVSCVQIALVLDDEEGNDTSALIVARNLIAEHASTLVDIQINYFDEEIEKDEVRPGNLVNIDSLLITAIFQSCINLKSLYIQNFTLDEHTMATQQEDDEMISSNITLIPLEVLRIHYCNFHTKFLSSISKSVPKLKELKLHHCQQLDTDHDNINGAQVDIHMPYTVVNLLNIKRLAVYPYLIEQQYLPIFCKVITYDGKNNRYLKWGYSNDDDYSWQVQNTDAATATIENRENTMLYSLTFKSVNEITVVCD